MSTCKHCGRAVTEVAGAWVDPEAIGDDSIWRETCDKNDTFTAEHEVDEETHPEDDDEYIDEHTEHEVVEPEDVVIQVQVMEHDMATGEHLSSRWTSYSRCTRSQARAFLAQSHRQGYRAVDWITFEPVDVTS